MNEDRSDLMGSEVKASIPRQTYSRVAHARMKKMKVLSQDLRHIYFSLYGQLKMEEFRGQSLSSRPCHNAK